MTTTNYKIINGVKIIINPKQAVKTVRVINGVKIINAPLRSLPSMPKA